MTSFGGESMARIRRYHPLVADDLASAIAFYDDISVELGNRFRTSIRDRLEKITDRPDSYGCIHEQLRTAMIDRFPYLVVFEHGTESVAILGVFHAASDQERWINRSR
jgi:hypothetical protein